MKLTKICAIILLLSTDILCISNIVLEKNLISNEERRGASLTTTQKPPKGDTDKTNTKKRGLYLSTGTTHHRHQSYPSDYPDESGPNDYGHSSGYAYGPPSPTNHHHGGLGEEPDGYPNLGPSSFGHTSGHGSYNDYEPPDINHHSYNNGHYNAPSNSYGPPPHHVHHSITYGAPQVVVGHHGSDHYDGHSDSAHHGLSLFGNKGHGSLALKGLLIPLAGIALLGAAAALSSNPVLLQLGVVNGRRRRRRSIPSDSRVYPLNPMVNPDNHNQLIN